MLSAFIVEFYLISGKVVKTNKQTDSAVCQLQRVNDTTSTNFTALFYWQTQKLIFCQHYLKGLQKSLESNEKGSDRKKTREYTQ